ncbi:hypothetical protein F5X99DRAFT_366919, partial [Biscogniauxia marginata]
MYMITPLFLAALALAAPQDALRRSPLQCPSGSYKCSDDSLGWEVCNVHGEWVVSCVMILIGQWKKKQEA